MTLRTPSLADAFDRRFPYVPTLSERVEHRKPRAGRKERGEAFWERIRAEFMWLSQAEIAERHRVDLSTAKHWTARAFRGRP